MQFERARVLLVDDDPEDQMILRRVLSRVRGLDAELSTASSYAEAVDLLAREDHDLYLVDYFLGDRTGLDLVAAIRRRDLDVPVILLTSLDEPERDLQALRHGASDYLAKHRITASELQRVILHARERALAVRALRASEERHALALEGSNDGIWDWDLRGGSVHFSPRWWGLLGVDVPPSNATCMSAWWDRVHPADRDDLRRALDAHLEGRTAHFECEFRMHHASGAPVWVLARGVGVRDADGTVRRMAGSLTDTSERRQAQERLLSHVSHELRTPLTAIYQFLTNLRDGLAGDVNELQDELLGASLRNVKELERMVNDLVEATRAREEGFSLDRRGFAADELLGEVHATGVPIAARSGHVLRLHLDTSLPPVYGDRSRLRQVLVNLMTNALQYTPPGGNVVLSVHRDVGHAGRVVFEVSDDGPGIAPDQQQRIFERLYQIDPVTPRARKGLGIGLYLCKEIVARHEGSIWVHSRPGQGAAFCFTIPVFEPAALVAPVVDAALRRARGLVMIELTPVCTTGARAGETEPLRRLRTLAERCTQAAEGIVLPVPTGNGGRESVLVVAPSGKGDDDLVPRLRASIEHGGGPVPEQIEWSVVTIDANQLRGNSTRGTFEVLNERLRGANIELVH